MKIFVGWSFDAEWVERYVIPLVMTYGVEVLTGKELQGKEITSGVKAKIAEADGALFITTRRGDKGANGLYETSDWVLDEIRHASAINKSMILEVREEGVDYANKINADRQYIPLDPNDYMMCLVEIGKAIGQGRGLRLKLRLSPAGPASDKQAFTDSLMPRLSRRAYECLYRIRQQGEIIHNTEHVQIVREGQDQFIYTAELPTVFFKSPDAFLEVEVKMGDAQWLSPGIRFNALDVPLESLDSNQFSVRKREV